MIYNFDITPDRHHTDSVKWRHYGDDVLPLWVADMDFPSPQPVIQALEERVAHGVFGYTDDNTQFRQVLVERMAELYNWEIQSKDIVFVPGVVVGFNLASHTVATPDGGVLVQTPVYPPMLGAAAAADMTHQETELSHLVDGFYSIDFDAFEAAVTAQTRLFLLCNPHNPTGRVFTQVELEQIAEICLKREVVICSDEIHCDLIFPGYRHIPIASLDPEIAQNTITLVAPSKTFNIAGLECSAAIIQNPVLRGQYKKASKGLVGGVNLLGSLAGLVAYRDGNEWLQQLLVYLEANRDFLYDYVQREFPGISMTKPEGTYLAWLDCRQALIKGNPHEFFLREARVALNDGVDFGRGGEGFVRLNFGCSRLTLTEALERMKNSLQRLKKYHE
ncbi:MAG: PatB family C-S lyase [Anaerolineales bacterium]|nr:PatB family C-S lyase [Anaerolineales bacterium]